jgi:hypothetical protein
MKQCFKCGRMQPLSEFYRHSEMADGHLNKCKACTKRDVRMHRRKSEGPRAYDRRRAKQPARKALARKTVKRWRANNPKAYQAQMKLGKAVRSGKIKRLPCEVCGDPNVHGHHRDYSKPLEVIWLCARHHHAAHGITRAV